MIASALSPAVVASGDLVARTETWAVTTSVDAKAIYPTLRDGTQIRVLHITHCITCHHLPTGRKVVFARKSKRSKLWHDSRKMPVVRQRGLWAAPESENDWRGTTVTRQEVVAEVARMGGGERAAAIVSTCC
jgi:hypothetical protein